MTTTIYPADSIDTPTPVQQEFTNHYDMNHPLQAIHDYARIMHLHTKRQMENATRAARRRTKAGSESASLTSQSSNGSVDGPQE